MKSLVHAYVQSRFSCVNSVTLWTVACQAPLSMGFSRREYWSGLPCPPPGDLPDPGIKPMSLSTALAGGFFTTSATWEAQYFVWRCFKLSTYYQTLYFLYLYRLPVPYLSDIVCFYFDFQIAHQMASGASSSFCCCLVTKSCPTLLRPHGL